MAITNVVILDIALGAKAFLEPDDRGRHHAADVALDRELHVKLASGDVRGEQGFD